MLRRSELEGALLKDASRGVLSLFVGSSAPAMAVSGVGLPCSRSYAFLHAFRWMGSDAAPYSRPHTPHAYIRGLEASRVVVAGGGAARACM